MIVCVAVVTGFKKNIREKLFAFTGHVHVSPFNGKSSTFTEAPIYLDQKLIAQTKKLPYVTQVAPFAERPVILQSKGKMEGVELKGLDKSYRFSGQLEFTGKPIDYSDTAYSRQIILSQTVASKLDIGVGDSLYIQFFSKNTAPRIRKVKVAGFFHSGLDEVDKVFALCDLRMLQHINQWSADSINAYQVELSNEAFADSVSNLIHYDIINPPLESYTSVENYQSVFDWLNLQSLNGQILLIIMAIVAIINLGTILLILIVDRAAMIGLFKAMGMSIGGIIKIFLSLGSYISLAGVILGNVVGLTLCYLQYQFHLIKLPEETYFMRYAPIEITWWQIAIIDGGCLAVFVLFILLPSLYILRIQPSRVLQFK